jgi:uncharacterized membrane protein YqjE
MIKYLLLLTLTILFINKAAMSQTRLVKGIVKDSSSQIILEYCNVYVLNSTNGTNTDSKGKFKIAVIPI